MAGKKKKNVANKLAKMSDEERARYLQHRADVEEEARRRKEQLISTFLKNKLKKEETFARLNIAKINQGWHQILRTAKCKEMKENAQHMREWIERTISLKNRTINLLIDELDEAEFQYGNNFKAHLLQIDAIIERNKADFQKIRTHYEEERDLFIETHLNEQDTLKRRFSQEIQHLKTVQYGQSCEYNRICKGRREYYIKRQNGAIGNYKDEFKTMKKRLEENVYEIWNKIAQIIKKYVSQTDKRRLHFAELLRLDREGSAEIEENQIRILQEEETLTKLQKGYDFLMTERTEHILALEFHLKELTKVFDGVRKQLRNDLSKDERQLKILTNSSNESIRFLENLLKKGEKILFLANSCEKFEKEEEKFNKRVPPLCLPVSTVFDVDGDEMIPPKKSDSISVEVTKEPRGKLKKVRRDDTLKEISFSFEDDNDESKIDFLGNFECLNDLESFWTVYNKVEVDFLELQQQKRNLIEENKYLKGMARSIMEAEALSKSVPESKVLAKVCSRNYRGIQSASIKLIKS